MLMLRKERIEAADSAFWFPRNSKFTSLLVIAWIALVPACGFCQSEETRIDPDRPHLPEASTAAGKGRMVLEGGYTFNERPVSSFSSHDGPEAVFRVGAFTDWFEFRVGQNFIKQERTASGTTSKSSGAQDLYLGVKVVTNHQKGFLPQIALIPQWTVPTGSRDVTAEHVLPGVNVDGSWEVLKDRYSIEFVVANNRVSDDPQHAHHELATGFTHAFQVHPKLEAFGEWDMFRGSSDPAVAARHYAVGGLVFFSTKDFAVDFRAGAGLNSSANRFLLGTGFAFRH
jgi:hypothetical protein